MEEDEYIYFKEVIYKGIGYGTCLTVTFVTRDSIFGPKAGPDDLCIAFLSPTPLVPPLSKKEKIMVIEKQLQDELAAPSICDTQDSTSQASASSSSFTQAKIYCMVLRAPSDSKQNEQVGDDTLTREHMKTEKDTGETQGLMTDDDVRKFLEALAHSKQDEIPEVSWKSYVDFFCKVRNSC